MTTSCQDCVSPMFHKILKSSPHFCGGMIVCGKYAEVFSASFSLLLLKCV